MAIASIAAAGGSLGLALVLIPLILRVAHRFKWYDKPNKRKIHTGLIPRLGGPGIFVAWIVAALAVPYLLRPFPGMPDLRYSPRFAALFGGVSMFHLLGLYDDFRNLRAPKKFVLQLAAAAIIASGGFLIRSFSLPYIGTFGLGFLAYPVTVIWIVGIANAVNLIDGMDGLAGGIAAFAAASMGVIALIQGAIPTAVFAFSILGAVVGFLVFNFPPARIFMGDSGSMLLGSCLASVPLLGGISKASAFGSLIVPVTLLTIPILDTAAAILRRLRHRRPIISPDREHIHHRLLDLGLEERQILGILYGFSFYLSVVAVTSVVMPAEANVYLVLVVWVGSLLAYWLLGVLDERKRAAGRETERDGEDSSLQRRG